MSSLEVTEPILNFPFDVSKRATKGFNKREEVKRKATERWVRAVNAEGSFVRSRYGVAKQGSDVPRLTSFAAGT